MNLIVLRLSTRFLFLMNNIIFARCDKDTRCTVTHDRAENPVFGWKLSAQRNTRDTSRILCMYVAGMRARARSRLRGGKVWGGKGDINYYRLYLFLSRTRMWLTSRDVEQ